MPNSSPQLEDGYVRIANELFDAFLATDFTKRESLIVLAVIRKTYGYGKRADDITVSQLSYMTGIGRSNASRTFHGLVRRKVLTIQPGTHGHFVSLNKHYWEWDDRAKTTPRRDIFERDGWHCRSCGRDTPEKHSGLYIDAAPELDHVVEVANGGSEDPSNLQLLCRRCHQTKTRAYLSERVERDTPTVSEGTRNRVEGDTETVSIPTRERVGRDTEEEGVRVERDTPTVSEGTRLAYRNRHNGVSESTHTKDNPKRQLQKTTPKDSCAAPSVTAAAWTAYATAYQNRYGEPPVRNQTVNAQLANFVKRIGSEEAPHVAAFYVASSDAFYLRRGHSVGAMLADAEKLRTEWATGRQSTVAGAREADRVAKDAEDWRAADARIGALR